MSPYYARIVLARYSRDVEEKEGCSGEEGQRAREDTKGGPKNAMLISRQEIVDTPHTGSEQM